MLTALKIIHIVENLDKGAVENWLVRVFVESRRVKPDWKWTFYCILPMKGRLDDLVRKNGGEVIYTPVTISKKFKFLKALRNELLKGKYDIIHSHHDYLSGFYLLASCRIQFGKRILHIHNTDRALPVGNRYLHQLLLEPFKMLGFLLNDTIVGISYDTLSEFVGKSRKARQDFKVLYYGIDLSVFRQSVDECAFKREIDIPLDAKVLLFVGRMNPFKNPVFLVEILNEILKHKQDVYAVFVGKGDTEKQVLEKSTELGIVGNIRMLGWRNDTASLMKMADIFVFPRLEKPKEGLGLVVVEAQAAGLPMILSHGIVEDAIVVKELANFLPLSNNPAEWAEKILNVVSRTSLSRSEALRKVSESDFELCRATQNFISLYEC